MQIKKCCEEIKNQFKWHKMKELTLELSEVYDDFREAIEAFIEGLKG